MLVIVQMVTTTILYTRIEKETTSHSQCLDAHNFNAVVYSCTIETLQDHISLTHSMTDHYACDE